MGKRRPSGDGMVRKRDDGRWEGRIVVGHKENGASIFKYVYADTQKELTTKLRQHIDAYRGVDLTEQSRMTLAQWLDRWLEQMSTVLRPSTLSGYRGDMEHHVKPYLGGKQLMQITAEDLRKLYKTLKQSGRVKPRAGEPDGLSDTTVHGIHTTLHHALKTAEEEGLIPSNPANQVIPPKASHKPKQILNDEQLNTFMKAIEADELWRDFFYTEMTTGLRRGEICGLRWDDFDRQAGTLHVRRTVHREKGKGLTVGNPKTYAGTRSILLPPSTAQLLRQRRSAAASVWIFPDPLRPEQPTDPDAAYRQLKRILEHAGLPSIKFHACRDTFATHALSSGVDAKTLAGILGHTRASFTLDTYTHVTGDMQKRAAEVVGDFMTELFGEDLKPWERN